MYMSKCYLSIRACFNGPQTLTSILPVRAVFCVYMYKCAVFYKADVKRYHDRHKFEIPFFLLTANHVWIFEKLTGHMTTGGSRALNFMRGNRILHVPPLPDFANFSTKYFILSEVYTDEGGMN